MKRKAFTLVELIVVITILAILGTIAFISLSGYSKEARDAKRATDTSSLLNKINIEYTRGIDISDLITKTETGSLQILGKTGSLVNTFGIANFEVLKENKENFKDPSNKKQNYPLAYAIGGKGKEKYRFIQIATISEKENKAVIKGNYYRSEAQKDAESLFLTGGIILEDGGEKLPYEVEDNGKDDTKPGEPEEAACIELDEPGFFEFDAKSGTITGYSNEGGKDVKIPCKIGGVDVVEIGYGAFSKKYLYNLTIPNSIKKIGDFAFQKGSLENLIIPDSVISIGESAFGGNQLTNLVISNSVQDIGEYAFGSNELTNIFIPNSVINIGHQAFIHNQLTSVVISDSVKDIGMSAFAFNQLTDITIGNSVTNIGYQAFHANQLTSVVIPNSVTNIGESAFSYNQLTDITFKGFVADIGTDTFGSQFDYDLIVNGTINGPLKMKEKYYNSSYFDMIFFTTWNITD